MNTVMRESIVSPRFLFFLFIFLFFYLLIYLFIYLITYLFIYLFNYLFFEQWHNRNPLEKL